MNRSKRENKTRSSLCQNFHLRQTRVIGRATAHLQCLPSTPGIRFFCSLFTISNRSILGTILYLTSFVLEYQIQNFSRTVVLFTWGLLIMNQCFGIRLTGVDRAPFGFQDAPFLHSYLAITKKFFHQSSRIQSWRMGALEFTAPLHQSDYE